MKALAVIIFISICFASLAQPTKFPKMHASYIHPKLDSILATHQTIAFLGEYTYLTRRVDEASRDEYDSITQGAIRLAYYLAKSLRDDERITTVLVQHPDSTYTILIRAGIKPGETSMYDRNMLAEILDADAIVTMRLLVFKKYYPTEAHVRNILSLFGTFGMAAHGFYVTNFPLVAGTDITYESTAIHTKTGELIYLDNGINTVFPKMNPGGLQNKKAMRDFPYFKK
jgi:hypothetical protein